MASDRVRLGIFHIIFVGDDDQEKVLESLSSRLQAIGFEKGEFSKNESLKEAMDTIYKKIFPQQTLSKVNYTSTSEYIT